MGNIGVLRFRVESLGFEDQGLGIRTAQCRSYLQTLEPNVGIIYRHGSPGKVQDHASSMWPSLCPATAQAVQTDRQVLSGLALARSQALLVAQGWARGGLRVKRCNPKP